MKIMTSSPITSWKIEGEKWKVLLTDFIFLGSKITAGSDCSYETEKFLLLGRKAVTNLDSILESRDVTLQTKIHNIKAVAFPLAMSGLS